MTAGSAPPDRRCRAAPPVSSISTTVQPAGNRVPCGDVQPPPQRGAAAECRGTDPLRAISASSFGLAGKRVRRHDAAQSVIEDAHQLQALQQRRRHHLGHLGATETARSQPANWRGTPRLQRW